MPAGGGKPLGLAFAAALPRLVGEHLLQSRELLGRGAAFDGPNRDFLHLFFGVVHFLVMMLVVTVAVARS